MNPSKTRNPEKKSFQNDNNPEKSFNQQTKSSKDPSKLQES